MTPTGAASKRLVDQPALAPLADALLEDLTLRLWLLGHTAHRFGLDPTDQEGVAVAAVQPQFFGGGGRPDALAAVRTWTAGLFASLERQDTHVAAGQLAALEVPVTLLFGAADPYLNPTWPGTWPACSGTRTSPCPGRASHWPQGDQPELVARLITQAAAGNPRGGDPMTAPAEPSPARPARGDSEP